MVEGDVGGGQRAAGQAWVDNVSYKLYIYIHTYVHASSRKSNNVCNSLVDVGAADDEIGVAVVVGLLPVKSGQMALPERRARG